MSKDRPSPLLVTASAPLLVTASAPLLVTASAPLLVTRICQSHVGSLRFARRGITPTASGDSVASPI